VILDLLTKDPARRPTAAMLEPRLRRVAEGVVGVARPTTRIEPPPALGDGWRGPATVTTEPPPTWRNRVDR
jgi:hypothetical protein